MTIISILGFVAGGLFIAAIIKRDWAILTPVAGILLALALLIQHYR